MESRWKTIDTVMAVFLVLAIIGWLLFAFSFSSFFIGNKQKVEVPISGKISEKGLYFGPTYKIITENNGNSYVTKNQFYHLHRGEMLSGYKTDQLAFFTTTDALYDGALIITFLIGLTMIIILFVLYFYRKYSKKPPPDHMHFLTRKQRWHKLTKLALIIYVILSFGFLLLVFSNLYHQVTPFGQSYTEANIIDKEINKRYGRFATDDFYFYIAYKDKDDHEYLVKKQVNFHIYDTYKNQYGIPIHYPKKHPANAFIQLQSLEDYSTSLMSFQTFLIIAILYSYTYIYKKFKKQ